MHRAVTLAFTPDPYLAATPSCACNTCCLEAAAVQLQQDEPRQANCISQLLLLAPSLMLQP